MEEVKNIFEMAITVFCLAVSIVFFLKYRKRKPITIKNIHSCYLKSQDKPQHTFKRVLANNSYSPFDHLQLHDNFTVLHPYQSEVKALIEKPPLGIKFSNGITDMGKHYIWVDNELKLKEVVEVSSNEIAFGVDTEQHQLHSFMGFTALVQISTKDFDYLLDTISLHDCMDVIRPVFADPKIWKIFHGADNDILWLQRDFHIYVVNLFDTAKACDLLSKPHRSLAYLLEEYCGVTTNKLYQREDWRQRPLSVEMVQYARMDAHYLLYIADCLVSELQNNDLYIGAIGRSNGLCLHLFNKELEECPGQCAASSIISRHLKNHGSIKVDMQFEDLVRRLCFWRDLMARIHDESVKYVLSDNAVVALAETIPLTTTDICTTISQADIDVDVSLNSSSPHFPSPVVLSHVDFLPHLLQDEIKNFDDIYQDMVVKYLGQNGSCPLSLYNYRLLSKTNIDLSSRLVSKGNRYKSSDQVAGKANLSVQKTSCKAPPYHDYRIYTSDGKLYCYCARKKFDWYLRRSLAKYFNDDRQAIMLLFEPIGRPGVEGFDFCIQSKRNKCVGCGEENQYSRYNIIPSCYRKHFPNNIKLYNRHDIVLLCVTCYAKAYSSAEEHKKKVALEFGLPLSLHEVSNGEQDIRGSSVLKVGDGGVSLSQFQAAAVTLIRHGSRMPPQLREEFKQVVMKYYGGSDVSEKDLENALLVGASPRKKRNFEKKLGDGVGCASGSSKLSQLSHQSHGKQVVDYLLKEHGEEGIFQFIQRWRQVFLKAIHPRYLPIGWDVKDRR